MAPDARRVGLTRFAFHPIVERMTYHRNASRTTAADNARAIAARQKLSGREIARRLERTPVYVSRRLSGEVEFSESDIRGFAAVLDIAAADLLEDDDHPP